MNTMNSPAPGAGGATETVGLIPARWGSTRFPGKSLALIAGVPLVVRVWRRARQARALTRLAIATDDDRIRAAAEAAGAEVVMTRADHPSGTDRVAEAAARMNAAIVVNIQGDEPLIEPELIDRLAAALREDSRWDMATAVAPLETPADLHEPSVVKVVRAADGAALYFSRAAIPFARDGEAGAAGYLRHIGIYAYRRAFLDRLVREPPCALEMTEKLEQLRALHLGGRIRCLDTAASGVGVDAPADVARAEAALRARGLE